MLPNIFYIINFSISIFASSISLSAGFLMIIIVIINRQCRTITSMMMCNTAAATIIYSILQLISAGYGLRNDWFSYQPACLFRLYCYNGVCIAVCGSYAVQSISRLFFSVLYKHQYLLSWRIHCYLIIANYLLTIVGPIPLVFMKNGCGLEPESRLCTVTTKVFSASMWAVTIAYLIPLSIVTIIYGIILYRARQSTRRVGAFAPSMISNAVTNNNVPNFKREIKLMKNILILVGILVCAGIPYLTLVIWHVTKIQPPPPEATYLLAMITISVFFAIKMITLFFMNKEVRNIAVEYIRKLVRL